MTNKNLVDFVASILDTLEDRGEKYGGMRENHRRIAQQWSATMGHRVTAEQVALMMCQLKISRLIETPVHEDSIRDLIGYALIYYSLVNEVVTP
jgi:hypothetical protein